MKLTMLEIARIGSTFLGAGVATSVLGLAQGVLLTREMGPAEYGIVGLALAVPALLRRFFGFRTQEALTFYLTKHLEASDRSSASQVMAGALWSDVLSALAAAAIVLAAAPLAAPLFSADAAFLPALLIATATVVTTVCDQSWAVIVRYDGRLRTVAIEPVASAVALLLLLVAAWRTVGLSPQSVIACRLIVGAVRAFVLAAMLDGWVARMGLGRRAFSLGAARASLGRQRDFWVFMRRGFLSNTLLGGVKEGDLVMLSLVSDEAQIGYYRLARNLATSAVAFGAGLSQYIYQSLTHSMARRGSMRDDLAPLVKISATVAVLTLAGFVVGSVWLRDVIVLVFGTAYAPAAAPAVILILWCGVTTMFFWISPALFVHRLTDVYLRGTAVSFLVLFTGLPLAYFDGASGMAIATLLCWSAYFVTVLPPLMRALWSSSSAPAAALAGKSFRDAR